MAVAFDAVGPSSSGTGASTASSLSWTHTVGSVSNPIILVGAEFDYSSDTGVTASCTSDNSATGVTSLGKVESNNAGQGFVQVWSITGAGAAPGSHTIKVSASSSANDIAGGSVSFSGAGGTGTPVTAANTSSTNGQPSVSVTAAASSFIAGFVTAGDSILTENQTRNYLNNFEGGAGFAAGNIASQRAAGTGSSTTISWTGNAAPWAVLAVEITAAPALPTPVYVQPLPPGWFPGSDKATAVPGGIPFAPLAGTTDAAPAVIIPPTPEAAPFPAPPLPPGWFPGADRVTTEPGGVPFAQQPPPADPSQAVLPPPAPDILGIPDWLPLPPGYFPGSQNVTVDPGGIPFYAQPVPLLPPPPGPGTPVPPFLTGVAGTGTGQYFTDQYGQPYMLRWDTVWNLIVNAGNSGGATTWQSDMDGYTATRSAEGFNGFLVTTVATTAIPGAPFANGNTWDGVAPFSGPGVLNGPFWARVDYLLNSAGNAGLTVVINACYTYSLFNSGAPLNGWTNAQFQAYGAAVGARYASQQNVIWEVGDDYGGSWVGGQIYDGAFSAFLTGLRNAGARQMISVENMSEGASRYSIDLATTYTWGVANASFDWVYSYDVAYTAIEDAYTEAANKSVASLPVVKMDGWYDNQYNGGTLTETVELFGRKWIWWSLSSGSRGAMYGQNEVYQWLVNTLSNGLVSSSPGSQYVQPSALNTAWNTFASLPGWHLLVPDTSSALVTAGRGTRSNGAFGTGAGTAGPTSMYLGGNTYVTASITATGSLAVIYMPAANTQTITVNGSLMQAGYTATWFDPASGAQTPTAVSATYTRSTANSAGDHDWLLVLQAPVATAIPAPLAPVIPLAPGWFPGADRVTAVPGAVPFAQPPADPVGAAAAGTPASGPPVYPLGHPVQARRLPQRGGSVTSRAGTYAQAGPPVYAPHGPVRAQPATPVLTGRHGARSGVFGGTGPPVKAPSGPVAAQGRGLPPRGRATSRTGVLAGLGAPVTPPRGPVQARRLPQRGGSTSSRTGVFAGLGPAVRQPRGPVRIVPAPPPRGRSQSRAGTFTSTVIVSGPPVYPLGHPVRTRPQPPPRGRIVRAAGTYQGTGPPAVPQQQPVSAARRPLPPRGRTASQRGPYGQTGPSTVPLRRPVRGQPATPILTGRTSSRTGTFTAPPLSAPGCVSVTDTAAGTVTITDAAPAVMIADSRAGTVTVKDQACPTST